MKKALLLLIIAALFAAGIVSPAVSAAGTADGKDVLIENGDYVLTGERGLNFTKFAEGGYKWMVNKAGDADKVFNIINSNSVNIDVSPGKYVQSLTGTEFDGWMQCYVADKNDE